MPNYQPVYPVKTDTWHCRAVTANANLDGSGEAPPFTGQYMADGGVVKMIRILSEDATPAETYRLLMDVPGLSTTTKRLFWSGAVTVTMTEFDAVGLYVPPGCHLYGLTVGGEDADIYVELEQYQ